MLLEQIENKENLSRKDKAHYYLLLTEAQDKTSFACYLLRVKIIQKDENILAGNPDFLDLFLLPLQHLE